MAKFYNLADQKLFEKYQFLPQEKYRLGLNLPTDEDPDPVVDEGIVNTNSFANSGGGGDGFNAAGNMFGEGTAVNPVYGSTPITGGLGEAGTGVNPITGDIVGGGNIVDEFGTKGEVYSKGAFDGLKSEEEKKGFLSKMRASFNRKTENLPEWAKKGMTVAGMITAPIPTLLGKIFGGGGGGPQYGIAGLTDQQKNLYDNLAASGFLYETPSGYKTKTGKNFTGKGYLEGQIKNFNEMTEEGYTIDSNGNVVKPDGTLASGYLKNKFLESKLSEKNNTVTNPNITNPNITANMINEFADNNNTPIDTPPQDTQTPNQDGVDNRFDGPGAGTGGGYDGSQNDRPDDKQDNDGGQGDRPDNSGGGGQTNPGKGSYGPHFARGGRAGYFFGGRAGYAEGGPIYSRLGTLSSGVQSAEQQLQGINASLQKAESDLGSESPGGGSSLAGGPSFTSNFEDANNQGPGSNLLYGGSSGINSQATPPGQGSVEEPAGPLGSLYGGDKPIRSPMPVPGNPELAGSVSSIGDEFRAGVKTGGAGQTLTGQELVNQIQMRIQQRDLKTPGFNAYAQEVIKTGGYPTKQFEDYSDLDSNFFSSKPMEQLQSSGGGLGGLFGGGNAMPATPIGTPGQGSLTQNSDPFRIKSIEERKQIAEDMNSSSGGLGRADGTRVPITYEQIADGRNTMPSMPNKPVDKPFPNFFDINKGIGSIL